MARCPLCHRHDAELTTAFDTKNNLFQCQTCGNYVMTRPAVLRVEEDDVVGRRHILSGLARQANRRGAELLISTENVVELLSSVRSPGTPLDGMDKALLLMKQMTSALGETVHLSAMDYPVIFATGKSEFSYILNSLSIEGLVENPGGGEYRITLDGWRRLEELRLVSADGNKAFVAMSFNDEMRVAWTGAIEPALRDTGFEPLRVDVVEHNEKIDDLIISEIRQSSLVVADFTGQRGGVYFEAGFAMGLGIPVIWTCRSGEEELLHFDTRQYNHIIWADEAELRRHLTDRIGATVGRRN